MSAITGTAPRVGGVPHSYKALWAGRILTGLITLLMLFDGVNTGKLVLALDGG